MNAHCAKIVSFIVQASSLLFACLLLAEERGIGAGPIAAETRPGQYHLLVIGIDEYLNWPRLPTAVGDARAVEETLTAEYGFRAQNVTRLYNAQATASAIVGALRKLVQQLAPDDSLFIFYAGRGHLDDVLRTGAWVPVEGKADDPTTWVQNSTVTTAIRAMKARQVLLASDSCFAGDFSRGTHGALPEITPEYARRMLGKTSRQVLSSGGQAPLGDAGSAGHSVFAYFLLKALRENQAPYLLATELFERLRQGVAAHPNQNPQLGMLQDSGAEVDGEFVFCRRGVAGVLDEAVRRKQEPPTMPERMQDQAGEAPSGELAVQQQKEAELAALDAKIAEIQKKLSGSAPGDATLDQLVALTRQRETQGKELERLRRQAEEEKRERESGIDGVRQADLAQKKTAFETHYAKYREVADSSYATDEMKLQAWQVICRQWNVTNIPTKPGNLYWQNDGTVAAGPASGGGASQTKVLDLGGGVMLELVWIAPGEFLMGSPASEAGRDNDELQHQVTISRGFWIGKHEVTQHQWQQVMGHNPSHFKNAGPGAPVERVSWDDAVAFCRKIGARLPTEAEWEYACRAGTTTPFAFGAMISPDQVNYDGTHPYGHAPNGQNRLTTVGTGSFPPNAWGLYDLHGNVWEWCADWDGGYPSGGVTDPTGPDFGSSRVLRGGSWFSSAQFCRSAARNYVDPLYRFHFIGFRVVVER